MYFQRSEEHTSELQSLRHLVCRLLLEKKNADIATVRVLQMRPLGAVDIAGSIRRRSLATRAIIEQAKGVLAAQTGLSIVFFFNDTATTEIYTLSLHDALPI